MYTLLQLIICIYAVIFLHGFLTNSDSKLNLDYQVECLETKQI